ncbi:BppU family phage baseplate upper protein [Clostridium perfringens]|nr:BppU family phage baseplate upper protein [Clostridium perfringens]MDM0969762.1 BppU family phage baseplate upper protein [Clostridium perfringens]
MAKKDIKFTLDTIDSRYSPVGTVKQLDSVFFYIKITENGVTKDLTGQTIKLFAIKEDKKIVEQTTKINITNQSEGLVEIELLNAAIQVHGFTYFELEISDSNGIISTADFILRVNKRVGSPEAIESTNEVSTLKEIEVYVAQAKQEIKKFKNLQSEMLKTNESINNQEALREEAEAKRGKAEKIRDEKIKLFESEIYDMQEASRHTYTGVEALNNTFTLSENELNVNYPNENGFAYYAYTTSIFSGWGTEIGRHQFVKSIKFKIKARDVAISQLKISLHYDSIDGIKLYNELREVNIQPQSESEIEIIFKDIIVNPSNKILYLTYQANSLIDMWGYQSLLEPEVKPPFYYWTNGNLDFNSKTQVTGGGTTATQVTVISEISDYDVGKGIMKYSEILNKDALKDTFVLSSEFIKTNENGQYEYDSYDRSTFSGWGSHLGDYTNIKAIKFKVKNRGVVPTTKIKCWITEFNKDGEVLMKKTFSVNIKPNETETIIWTFNTPFNSEGKKLYLCYATDTLTTLVTANMPFVGDNERVGWLSYTTNTNLNNLSPRSFSQVYGDTGTAAAIRIEVGEMKPTLDPTPNFIKKISNNDPIPSDSVRVILPDRITCVVGDTLQLFYRGLVEAVNPYNYDIRIRCRKGKTFTRYFEFTPLTEDVGEYDFTIEVYNNAKNLLAKAQCKLKVVNALNSPSSTKNILCIGDSLTSGGYWCIEAKRRLLESGGEPIGLNKTNINFIGTKRNQNCSFEGYGGWTWNSYLAKPNILKEDIWVYCTHDKTTRDQHSIWQDANGAKWKLETIEPNRLKLTRFESHTNPIPTAPGILTHVQNAVNTNNISFTQCTVADANPFWNLEADRVDFKKYCETNNFNGIDYVYTLLTWNGGRADMATIDDNKVVIDQAKQLIDFIHRDYPNAKIRIMGIPLPSLNGGTGANYGANGGYADTHGLVRGVFGLNLAYQEFANREEYKDFVEFINVSGQFDSENNMPSELVKVNTRSTKTELRGTNGVHPTMEGYYQIADVAYRQLVKDLLQN